MTRRRRIAVPRAVMAYPRDSGVGKVWHRTLGELGSGYIVRGLGNRRMTGRLWRPDAWIHDGHQGPLAIPLPVVALLQEAAWSDESTRATLAPDFLTRYEEPSRRAALQAARVVTPSVSSREQVLDTYGIAPDRVVVAPYGVDASVFRPDVGGASQMIGGAGGDPGRPYVLFVSQLHPRKNVSALREAMHRLIGRGYPHLLVLVGGPAVDRMDAVELTRAATAELPGAPGRIVHLRGISEEQIAALMAGAAAFCLPSLMEGFGLTALEAMACGAPVIVSDRGALPEVVAGAGLVVSPTADALEAALIEVLSDAERAATLRRAGLERSRRFTWRATAEGWERALSEAMG